MYSQFMMLGQKNIKLQSDGVRKQGDEENIWAKMEEVTGDWRRLLDGKLHDLYASPNTIILIKLGIWHTEEGREVRTWFWWGNLKKREDWEDLGMDGNIQ